MNPLTEEQALQAVETARLALKTALDTLRDVRGEPADEPCRMCQGSGHSLFTRHGDEPQPCHRCTGTGRQPISFPWVVTRVQWDDQPIKPALFHPNTTWVRIRPCDAACEGKTYLGWLLGDFARSSVAQLHKDGTLAISMAMHNPAIFVPDLGRVVYGCESWWSPIETPEDLRQITDATIENVWYVKALKDLTGDTSGTS
jgi:hypothetical protein